MLDPKITAAAQIAAAVAANAMPALRLAVNSGLEQNLTKEDIQSIIGLAQEIKQQPNEHTHHLVHQLLREPAPKKQAHSPQCACGCHDHHH